MKITAKLLVPILAVSLSQIARAVIVTSAASGNWSSPASWAPDPVPDTYGGTDDVLINGGFTINYDAGMTTPGGGFAVANGNNVTIDGGTLTQTVVTQIMRVGEGSGTVSGTGSLTINSGGVLNTGAAFGLAVGSKLSGGTFGDGLLDILDGSLILGAGAAANGFGVGMDGSDGILNVGDGLGSADTSIVDLSTNNIQLYVGSGALGGATGGAVNINSDGRINFGTGNINIGLGGGTGAMTIASGGSLIGGSGAIIVGGGGGTGTFTTAGTVTVNNEFSVGRGGSSNGTLNMSGGTITANSTFIGREGGTGTATISGGATTVNGQLYVGTNVGSTGTLTISNPGTVVTVTDITRIGNDNGTGTLNISGGALNSAKNLNVGVDGGVGHVNQTGGTVTFNEWAAIGAGSGAGGSSWTISGGNITSGAGLEVGSDRAALMNVSGTADISVNGYTVGVRNGGDGYVNMTGGTLLSTSQITVGGGQSAGTGTFDISAGTVTSNAETRVGHGVGATGFLNLSGTASWTSNGEFQVGNDGGTGVVNITGGTYTTTSYVAIGRNTNANGGANGGNGHGQS